MQANCVLLNVCFFSLSVATWIKRRKKLHSIWYSQMKTHNYNNITKERLKECTLKGSKHQAISYFCCCGALAFHFGWLWSIDCHCYCSSGWCVRACAFFFCTLFAVVCNICILLSSLDLAAFRCSLLIHFCIDRLRQSSLLFFSFISCVFLTHNTCAVPSIP